MKQYSKSVLKHSHTRKQSSSLVFHIVTPTAPPSLIAKVENTSNAILLDTA